MQFDAILSMTRLTMGEVEECYLEQNPFHWDAVRLRQWDDEAKALICWSRGWRSAAPIW